MNTASVICLRPWLKGFFIASTLFFGACDKENTSRVKYEVRCPSGCNVVYLSSTPTNINGVSGNWSTTLRMPKGDPFFLSALKTSVLGNVTVTVTIDGQSVAADQSSLPYGIAVVEGQIPL
jgi:hypothetical protein